MSRTRRTRVMRNRRVKFDGGYDTLALLQNDGLLLLICFWHLELTRNIYFIATDDLYIYIYVVTYIQ
jgi:hypothetical protein